MAEIGRLAKEEWDDLEPRLVEAERIAHESFMQSPETIALMQDQDKTPGYQLLQHLKENKDEIAIRLFRAMEMYHHELTRADITAAFLLGKEVGKSQASKKG